MKKYIEIETYDALLPLLQPGAVLRHYAFQNIEFGRNAVQCRYEDCIFFGCLMPDVMRNELAPDCCVLPKLPVPFNPFPAQLYTPSVLYAGYDFRNPVTFEQCYDTRIYRHYILKVFPGIQFGLFEDIMTEKLSGIVLETFGAGNIPMGNGDLLPIIKKAFSSGTVITVCSQCPSGTVTLGAYETSSRLKSAGAVSGRDMTTEAAVAKLYHLFSLGVSDSDIKRMMEENIAGELTQ